MQASHLMLLLLLLVSLLCGSGLNLNTLLRSQHGSYNHMLAWTICGSLGCKYKLLAWYSRHQVLFLVCLLFYQLPCT